MSNPVEGIEDLTELGAGSFIYQEYRGIFSTNGFNNYGTIEDSTVRCLLKAHKIRIENPSIRRVDLYAGVLQNEDIQGRELAGVLFIEIYLTQKVSNGVCETLGKLSNLVREGVRAKMGMLFLEANLRLHFVSPLEKAGSFFEHVRKMWVRCGGQQSRCESGRKRHSRKETVNPLGNDGAKSLTLKHLAKKRKLALRLETLLSIEKS